MKVTQLPYEIENLLKKDLHLAQKHIEDILIGGKPNHPVLAPQYLTPKLEEHGTVPKKDPIGALHHYRTIRNVLEYIFEHDGMIREKYRPMLQQIQAPSHVTALII